MRIRTVKPEFWQDELVASWPDATRLAFLGLLSESDDYGRVRWNADYLRSAIFPYDTGKKMERILAPIVESHRVAVYEHCDNTYALIINFHRHQKINRKSSPKLPPIDYAVYEDFMTTHYPFTDYSVSLPVVLPEHSSPRARARDQGTGNREQVTGIREVTDVSDEALLPVIEQGRLLADELRSTRKMPNLQDELVIEMLRAFPRCGLLGPMAKKMRAALVGELENMSDNLIANPKLWIRAKLSGMEMAATGGSVRGRVVADEAPEKRRPASPDADEAPPIESPAR